MIDYHTLKPSQYFTCGAYINDAGIIYGKYPLNFLFLPLFPFFLLDDNFHEMTGHNSYANSAHYWQICLTYVAYTIHCIQFVRLVRRIYSYVLILLQSVVF